MSINPQRAQYDAHMAAISEALPEATFQWDFSDTFEVRVPVRNAAHLSYETTNRAGERVGIFYMKLDASSEGIIRYVMSQIL